MDKGKKSDPPDWNKRNQDTDSADDSEKPGSSRRKETSSAPPKATYSNYWSSGQPQPKYSFKRRPSLESKRDHDQRESTDTGYTYEKPRDEQEIEKQRKKLNVYRNQRWSAEFDSIHFAKPQPRAARGTEMETVPEDKPFELPPRVSKGTGKISKNIGEVSGDKPYELPPRHSKGGRRHSKDAGKASEDKPYELPPRRSKDTRRVSKDADEFSDKPYELPLRRDSKGHGGLKGPKHKYVARHGLARPIEDDAKDSYARPAGADENLEDSDYKSAISDDEISPRRDGEDIADYESRLLREALERREAGYEEELVDEAMDTGEVKEIYVPTPSEIFQREVCLREVRSGVNSEGWAYLFPDCQYYFEELEAEAKAKRKKEAAERKKIAEATAKGKLTTAAKGKQMIPAKGKQIIPAKGKQMLTMSTKGKKMLTPLAKAKKMLTAPSQKKNRAAPAPAPPPKPKKRKEWTVRNAAGTKWTCSKAKDITENDFKKLFARFEKVGIKIVLKPIFRDEKEEVVEGEEEEPMEYASMNAGAGEPIGMEIIEVPICLYESDPEPLISTDEEIVDSENDEKFLLVNRVSRTFYSKPKLPSDSSTEEECHGFSRGWAARKAKQLQAARRRKEQRKNARAKKVNRELAGLMKAFEQATGKQFDWKRFFKKKPGQKQVDNKKADRKQLDNKKLDGKAVSKQVGRKQFQNKKPGQKQFDKKKIDSKAVSKQVYRKRFDNKKPSQKKAIKPIGQKQVGEKKPNTNAATKQVDRKWNRIGSKKVDLKKPVTQKVDLKKPFTKKAGKQVDLNWKRIGSKKADLKKPVNKKADLKKPVNKKADLKKPVTKKADLRKPVTKKAGLKKPVTKKAGLKKPVTKKAAKQVDKNRKRVGRKKAATKKPVTKNAAKVVVPKQLRKHVIAILKLFMIMKTTSKKKAARNQVAKKVVHQQVDSDADDESCECKECNCVGSPTRSDDGSRALDSDISWQKDSSGDERCVCRCGYICECGEVCDCGSVSSESCSCKESSSSESWDSCDTVDSDKCEIGKHGEYRLKKFDPSKEIELELKEAHDGKGKGTGEVKTNEVDEAKGLESGELNAKEDGEVISNPPVDSQRKDSLKTELKQSDEFSSKLSGDSQRKDSLKSEPKVSGDSRRKDSIKSEPKISGNSQRKDSLKSEVKVSGDSQRKDSIKSEPKVSGDSQRKDSIKSEVKVSGEVKLPDSGEIKPEESAEPKPEDPGESKPIESGEPKPKASSTGNTRDRCDSSSDSSSDSEADIWWISDPEDEAYLEKYGKYAGIPYKDREPFLFNFTPVPEDQKAEIFKKILHEEHLWTAEEIIPKDFDGNVVEDIKKEVPVMGPDAELIVTYRMKKLRVPKVFNKNFKCNTADSMGDETIKNDDNDKVKVEGEVQKIAGEVKKSGTEVQNKGDGKIEFKKTDDQVKYDGTMSVDNARPNVSVKINDDKVKATAATKVKTTAAITKNDEKVNPNHVVKINESKLKANDALKKNDEKVNTISEVKKNDVALKTTDVVKTNEFKVKPGENKQIDDKGDAKDSLPTENGEVKADVNMEDEDSGNDVETFELIDERYQKKLLEFLSSFDLKKLTKKQAERKVKKWVDGLLGIREEKRADDLGRFESIYTAEIYQEAYNYGPMFKEFYAKGYRIMKKWTKIYEKDEEKCGFCNVYQRGSCEIRRGGPGMPSIYAEESQDVSDSLFVEFAKYYLKPKSWKKVPTLENEPEGFKTKCHYIDEWPWFEREYMNICRFCGNITGTTKMYPTEPINLKVIPMQTDY